MPRNAQLVAKTRLRQARDNHERSKVIVKSTRTKLDAAIIAAVKAGIPRYEVAHFLGVSTTRIGQTPGLEPNRTIGEK